MQTLSLTINGQDIPAPTGIPTGGLSGDGGRIIGLGFEIFLTVAILLAFGFLIWGAINWITSEGDKTKVESARKQIIFSILGLVICLVSFFLVQLIGSTLGVDFFKGNSL